MKITKKVALIFLLLIGFNTMLSAQEKPALGIGDKAPELKYGKWLKGSPITDFKKGHLYLFEFWATWCGPCIASMPHLSEFAKAHKNDATVIAVDVWEAKDNSKPYESYWPKVERFVGQMGDKMAFNVVTDSKDQFMGNNWLKAAGQNGIPCTMMVKDGIIMWIGHPIELDSVVNDVMTGKFDIAVAKQKMADDEKKEDSLNAPFTKVYAEYDTLTKQKKYDEAITLLDSAITHLSKDYAGTFGFFKFMTMLEHGNEDKAMEFGKQWQATKPGYTGSAAAVILGKEGLKKSTYQYGMDLIKTLLDKPEMPGSEVYKLIATGYANMKDFKKAAEAQQKAVDVAKQDLKEGKHAGFVLEDTVKELEATLAKYKKGKK